MSFSYYKNQERKRCNDVNSERYEEEEAKEILVSFDPTCAILSVDVGEEVGQRKRKGR